LAGPQPLLITVSSPQQAVLEGLLRQHSTPQALALRVRIVLTAATGMRNVPLAHHLGCTPKTVIKWRARWAAAEPQLAAVEGTPADLKRLIARVLADAPRPGTPDTFTAEQIVQIINLACTSPADAGRPVDAWTPRELADEAVKRQIVASISPTSVGRFLKAGRPAAASQPLLAQCQDQSG
jgi:putative transposase